MSDIEFASAILNQVVGYVIFKIRGPPFANLIKLPLLFREISLHNSQRPHNPRHFIDTCGKRRKNLRERTKSRAQSYVSARCNQILLSNIQTTQEQSINVGIIDWNLIDFHLAAQFRKSATILSDIGLHLTSLYKDWSIQIPDITIWTGNTREFTSTFCYI